MKVIFGVRLLFAKAEHKRDTATTVVGLFASFSNMYYVDHWDLSSCGEQQKNLFELLVFAAIFGLPLLKLLANATNLITTEMLVTTRCFVCSALYFVRR